jgi:hypothetical protein
MWHGKDDRHAISFTQEALMQTTQGSVLESLQSVQPFLTDNADKLGGVVKAGARQKLDDAIVELRTHDDGAEVKSTP